MLKINSKVSKAINKAFITFLILSLQTRSLAWAEGSKANGLENQFQKIDSLNNLAFDVKRNDVQKAISLLYQASVLAKKLHYQKGLAENYLCEAGIYQQSGLPKKALALYYKSLEISRSENDKLNIAKATQQLGNLLAEGGHPEKAVVQYQIALNNFKALKKPEDLVNIQNSLGLVNLNQKKLQDAEKNFREALENSQQINYYYGRKKAIYNLGLLYENKQDYRQSLHYLNEALALDTKKNDRYAISLIKNKLAQIALNQKDYSKALHLGNEAFENAQVIAAEQLCIEALQTIGSTYRDEGQLNKVIETQNHIILLQKTLYEKEKNNALNFLDIFKDQYSKELQAERKAIEAQNKNVYFTLIATIAGICSIVFIVLTYFWRQEYKKVNAFSEELSDKTRVIEEKNAALKSLNNAMSNQNLRLEESNRMKDKLLSIVSHDLRQPLASTKSILDTINGFDLSAEETKVLFSDLEGQYIRALSLLDNLLFWIRGQIDGTSSKFNRVNLKLLIATVISEMEFTLKKKNISMVNSITQDIWMNCDAEMLKAVFRNLLSNAAKFTEEGWIKLYATLNHTVSIYIQDSGVGMDESTIEKVKEKIYYTTQGTNKEPGSGFGLMICSDLIHKHEGSLTIESTPGKGSTFIVTLPLSEIAQQDPHPAS